MAIIAKIIKIKRKQKMASLMERMLKSGTIKDISTLDNSIYFNNKDYVTTDLPLLNVAFSGEIDGGLATGLGFICGESRTYKTLLALYLLKAYLNKYKDGMGILYDSEYGVTPEYLRANGIDPSRVLHIPIENIEQMKLDMTKRLDDIKRGDKVFTLVDSLGLLASVKEATDALDGRTVGDMSRAKSIRSMLRIIGPHITKKDIPFVIINHIYMEQGAMYPKAIVSGGQAVTLVANWIFIVTKSQDKVGTELVGNNFTINIEKSRYVKEKSKFKYNVNYKNGINKWSGLLEWALESGHAKQSGAWYQLYDFSTNEFTVKKTLEKNVPDSYYEELIKNQSFKDFIKEKYKLTGHPTDVDEVEIDEDFDDEDLENFDSLVD